MIERPLDELKQFKHVEAPKEINVAVLRSLFELLGLSPGLAQLATQGSEEPVKQLMEAVAGLVPRVLNAATDMQGRLSFWGQPLLREEEVSDWRKRLDALKAFTESLSPYNTVGKLKNLRIESDDIDAQKKNLEVLSAVERMLELVGELGTTASYLSQAEMVLLADDHWVKKAQEIRKQVLDKLAQYRTAQHTAEYRQALGQLKKDCVTAYIAQHSRARLGVAEDKTKRPSRNAFGMMT